MTALWLSPVFENDGAPDRSWSSYHGYAIRNYLAVDPRFGTKDDLVRLVDEAHRRGMRVFLDAVANHVGDVFHYPGGVAYYYADDGRQYEIGGWNHPDFPVPVELRSSTPATPAAASSTRNAGSIGRSQSWPG